MGTKSVWASPDNIQSSLGCWLFGYPFSGPEEGWVLDGDDEHQTVRSEYADLQGPFDVQDGAGDFGFDALLKEHTPVVAIGTPTAAGPDDPWAGNHVRVESWSVPIWVRAKVWKTAEPGRIDATATAAQLSGVARLIQRIIIENSGSVPLYAFPMTSGEDAKLAQLLVGIDQVGPPRMTEQRVDLTLRVRVITGRS